MIDKKDLFKIFDSFCDKDYIVMYNHNINDSIENCESIKGTLINYNHGNLILYNDNGVYHIPYQMIRFMKPIPNKEG